MIHNDFLPEKLISRLKKDELCIFLFHGVAKNKKSLIRNYTGKHIDCDLFLKCMEALKKNGAPISMEEVLFIIENKKQFPKNSFAVTFDDGFENNLSVANPILNQLSIPFTIYLTTNFVENNDMSWTDRIEYATQNTFKQSFKENLLNKKFLLTSKDEKINFLNEIKILLKNDKAINPVEYSYDLCRALDVKINDEDKDEFLDKKISWEQVKLFKNNPLITFGGHSHTHRILSFLNKDELSYELDLSLNLLREKGDLKIKHYSYPEGLINCFSQNVIKEMKIRGIRCCPTAIDGTNNSKMDLFHLKRITV